MIQYRFVVHDSEGPLRAFATREAALSFLLPGMVLKVLPKPKRQSRASFVRALIEEAGEAMF